MKKSKLITVLTLSLITVLLLSTVCFAANLKNGSKGTEVKQLQMNLNGLGFDCGSADGAFGKNTEKAVKAFQKAEGLSVDGIAGKNTLSAIKKIAKSVQNDLKELGYDPGTADGIIGSKTVAALKKFQKDHGFSQTGVATDDVRDDLKDALKEMKANAAADKKAEEEAKKQAEAEKKAKEEAEKKAKEEAKKKAEAEKKAKEEAKKQVEAEKKAKEEAKKQAEADKKAAEEAKKKADAEKRVQEAKDEISAEIASFDSTAKPVNGWYVLDAKAKPNGAPLRSSPFNNGINNTVGGITADSNPFFVVEKGTNTKGNLWFKIKGGKYIFSENVKELANYPITYNANGGSGAPEGDKAYKGISLTISDAKPVRLGYRFIGWAENSTETTAKYKSSENVIFSKATTLYAVWEKGIGSYASTKSEVVTYSLKKDGDLQLTENFKVSEFRCKDGSDKILIDNKLVALLQDIRDHFGKPVQINSAYRTPSHNLGEGGKSKSRHLTGHAADIYISGVKPAEIAKYAESLGVYGIGRYSSFVHVDTRPKSEKFYWKTSNIISVSTFR